MNKNLYRIVFNRARGLFQVVAEIARGVGRNSARASHATAADSSFAATLGRLHFALLLAFGQAVIIPAARAQIVADPNAPGNQQPTVLKAANGVPLVNIQTPSAAGVSRNTYRQFDVDQQGAILNNARTNAQTQLGGWVQGNPWLARGTARVILNEVHSSDPSQLRGYVEVAGDRAQIAIANPAGISCDGCGFINAERATVTTGEPIVNGGSLEGYRVRGGTVRVDGKGMDASATHYTEVIARSVEVNANIWAQQLAVTTGTNDISRNVSTDHTQVQKAAATDDAPAFALDVGALGGMYAQKIVLVGTEHGVGVRNAGTLNARRIALTAQSLTNRAGAIEQTGTQDLALSAARVSNRDRGRIGFSVTDAPAGDTQGENATPNLGGTQDTTSSVTDSGSRDDPPHADLVPLADGALNIAATLNNDADRITAGGNIRLTASAGLDNDDGHLGVHQLDVRGDRLSNRAGELNVAADAYIDAALVDNDAGQMLVAGPVSLRAQNFSNRAGTFVAHSDKAQTQLTVAGQLDNHTGTLASHANRLTLDAAHLINTDGHIVHAGEYGLVMTATTFSGAGGQTSTAGSAQLHLGAGDHRNAALHAKQVALDAQSFDNRGGQIIAIGDTVHSIAVADVLDNNEGTVSARGNMTVRATSFTNRDGVIQAGQSLTAKVSGVANNSHGLMVAGDDLTLSAAQILNRDTQSPDVNKPLGLQGDRVVLTAQHLDNTDGTIAADSHIGIHGVDAQSVLNNTRGSVASGGSINAAIHRVLNPLGTLLAAKTLNIAADSLDGDDRLLSQDDLTLTLQQDFTNVGEVTATSHAIIHTAGLLTNHSLLQAGDLQVRATHINNTVTGQIQGQRTTVVAHDRLANRGLIDGGQTRIEVNTLDNVGTGRIYGDHLAIQADTIHNREEAAGENQRAAVIAARAPGHRCQGHP